MKKKVIIGVVPLIALLSVVGYLIASVFWVSIRGDGFVSISLANPQTEYLWIGGVPIQTNTNYLWVGGTPYVIVEVTAAGANISNSPTSVEFGILGTNSSNWSSGSIPTFPLDVGNTYLSITNSSGGAVSITINSTNFTGGIGWTIAATPGVDSALMKAGFEGQVSANMTTLTTSAQSFISGLADTNSMRWELLLMAPTSFSDRIAKQATITLTATLD